MSVIPDLPMVRPGLLMDFAGSGRVHPLLQVTRASIATCYGPDGLLRRVAANVPRINYDPETGECLGLLQEDSDTNLLLQSEDLSSSVWAKTRSSITSKVILSPDGVSLADAIVSDMQTAVEHYVAQASVVPSFAAGDRFYLSAFFKTGAKSKVALRLRRSLNPASYITGFFDLITGATNVTGAGGGAALMLTRKALPNGWHWCCIEYVAGTGDGADPLSAYAYPSDQMTGAQYDGTGLADIYIWGLQCTKGLQPSSYIPTTTSQATRPLENYVIPASVCAGVIGQDFTMVQRLAVAASIPPTGSLRHLGASIYANGNNRARIYANSANGGRIAFSGRLNNATDTFALSALSNLNITLPPIRAAIALSVSGVGRCCVNGGAVVTSAPQAGSLAGVTPTIYLGTLAGTANAAEQAMAGHIQRIAIYPGALSDAQLQRITAS